MFRSSCSRAQRGLTSGLLTLLLALLIAAPGIAQAQKPKRDKLDKVLRAATSRQPPDEARPPT